MVLSREEMNLLQDILHLQTNTDLILPEVQKAILFRREAVWKDQVVTHRVLLIVVLHQKAVADHLTVADHHQVPTLQDPTRLDPLQDPHPVLHQAEAEEVEVELQEEDSLKLYKTG